VLIGQRKRARSRRAADGERRFAVRWHAAVTLALLAAAAGLALDPSAGAALWGLGAVVAASVAGAILAQFGEEAGAVTAVLGWAAGGAAAALVTGGAGGPLAPLCLAPLAAGAAFGRPRLLGLGAAAGLMAAAVAALGGVFVPLVKPAEPVAIWLSLLSLGLVGLGLGSALVALQGRLRGDEARRVAEELSLREALDHQPQLLLSLYPGGRILEAFGEAPAGVDVHALADRHLGELVSAADRAQVEEVVARAAAEGSAEAAFVPSHDPDGWCALSVRRMSRMRLVAAVRDARAQRAREAELEAARELAEQQNAGKSRFLANMSHELRTPLNAIMGFADIMRQRLFGPMADRYTEYAELIHESGSHLLELINDVLDMSKIEAERFELSREDFDAREAVSGVLRLMRGQADRAGVNLRGHLPQAPLEADADKRAIKQITFNLISNALKFTPRGGSITVTLEADGQELVLAVADTGVGISAEDLRRLGRPFEQAGDAQHRQAGSGLGLSLVRAFARLHGGEMIMQSALGEGTTVTVRLPVLIPPQRIACEA
jgi:cell cycle sensor histidine kinase DivJ